MLFYPEIKYDKEYREHTLIRVFVIVALALLVKVSIVGAAPFAYVISAGNYINSGTVSVIDTSINNVTAMVKIGGYPGEVAATPDGTKIYVTDSGIGSTAVYIINTVTNSVIAAVNVDNQPVEIALGHLINPNVTDQSTKVASYATEDIEVEETNFSSDEKNAIELNNSNNSDSESDNGSRSSRN